MKANLALILLGLTGTASAQPQTPYPAQPRPQPQAQLQAPAQPQAPAPAVSAPQNAPTPAPACPPCDCPQNAPGEARYPSMPGAWPPFWPPMPPMPPADFRSPPPGFGEFQESPWGRERPARAASQAIRIDRNQTPDGYEVKIYLEGQAPEDIQISAQGRTLQVQNVGDQQSGQREDGSYWYARTFRQTQRWVSLPRDADMQNMTRSDGEDVIELKIPRLH